MLFRRVACLLLISLLNPVLYGQNIPYIDSLERLIKKDSLRHNAAHIFNELSWELNETETEKALFYGYQALRHSKKINNRDEYATALARIAVAYDIAGEEKRSLSYFRLALDERIKMKDLPACANILNNYGAFYFARNKPDSSLYYYKLSADLRRSLKDSAGLAQSYNNIGLVYRTKYQFGEALKAYTESLKLKEALSDEKGIFYTITNLTVLHLHLKHYREAWKMAERSLRYAESINDPYEIACAKINMGAAGTYIEDKITMSRKYLEEGIASLRSSGEKHNLAYGYNYLGNWFLENGDSLQAGHYYSLASQLSKELGKNELSEKLMLNLSRLFLQNGDYKKSAEMFNDYITLHDSLFNQESQRQYNELFARFENEKKERTISELSHENSIKDFNLRRNRFTQTILISVLTITLILIFFLIVVVRLRRKNEMILSEKNKISERLADERELLIREMHHRVKNNLQLVSSILSLQSKYTSEQDPVILLEASRQRIRSISIIHEQLYGSNELKKAKLDKYIEELINEIIKSSSVENINTELKIQDVIVDLDTAIPIGLIINELVTNSCKYAFHKAQEKLISVRLEINDEMISLEYSDNGCGFPQEIINGSQPAFGLRMIHSLCRKLKAQIEIKNNQGASVNLFAYRSEKEPA